MYLIIFSKCNITSWKYSWNGVWTLILLQYSHVVHTSVSILICHVIPEQESDTAKASTIFVIFCMSTMVTVHMYDVYYVRSL